MREDLINLSDHLPLTLALNMNILLNFSNLDQISMPSDKSTPISEKRLRWDHAPLGKYYDMTFNLIRPFVCIIDSCINALLGSNSDSLINDYICRSNILSHKASAILVIEEVYGGVVAALQGAAASCIPSVAPHMLKHWWNEKLNCLKKKSQLHYTRWRAAQKPNFGVLYNNYITARIKFWREIKKRKSEARKTINTG